MTERVWGGISMIPPHLFYQIYISLFEQNNYTPPNNGELVVVVVVVVCVCVRVCVCVCARVCVVFLQDV